jgi:deoxyribose-phosphate aldolase
MKIKIIIEPGEAQIEKRLTDAFKEAKKHRADFIEISYGTQAGDTKRRILNLLMCFPHI